MRQQPFRIPPAGPASAYRTFEVRQPRGPETTRPATCEEVGCEAFLNGWITRVPATSTDLITTIEQSGRPYTDITEPVTTERAFLFAAGTPCFQASRHTVLARPDLPQLFIARGGDWRGNPMREGRVHQRPEDWVEDFQEETSATIERIEKG